MWFMDDTALNLHGMSQQRDTVLKQRMKLWLIPKTLDALGIPARNRSNRNFGLSN